MQQAAYRAGIQGTRLGQCRHGVELDKGMDIVVSGCHPLQAGTDQVFGLEFTPRQQDSRLGRAEFVQFGGGHGVSFVLVGTDGSRVAQFTGSRTERCS